MRRKTRPNPRTNQRHLPHHKMPSYWERKIIRRSGDRTVKKSKRSYMRILYDFSFYTATIVLTDDPVQLFPHVKYVTDKFKHKLPKEDLKRYAKEVTYHEETRSRPCRGRMLY